MIVLATKPHQEDINAIRKFVCRMCVPYRRLNTVKKLYEYPISHCNMAITIMELSSPGIYFIMLGSKKGYNQIAVRKCM